MGTMNINRNNDLKASVELQANGQREQFQVVVRKLGGKALLIVNVRCVRGPS
jgi:lipoate-protein ligase A